MRFSPGGLRAGREAAGCAASVNCCVLILVLVGAASSSWTWGNAKPRFVVNGVVTTISVTLGQWYAGQAWTSYPVPCNCNNGICYNWCTAGTTPTLWSGISATDACDVNSTVYQTWSGPLNLCSFPAGFEPPPLLPAYPVGSGSTPSGVTGYASYGTNVPSGTTFNVPSQISGMQGVTIVACIFTFFAVIFGCIDTTTDSLASKQRVGLSACHACNSFLAFVFALTSVCLWPSISYVQKAQNSPPEVWVPIWVNNYAPPSPVLTAIPIQSVWLGPAWGCVLTGVILLFFTTCSACASIRMVRDDDETGQAYAGNTGKTPDASPNSDPIPTSAQPAVPPAMTTAGSFTPDTEAAVAKV